MGTSSSAFYNTYDDSIESLANAVMRNGLLVFQSRNVAQVRIYGAELRGSLELSSLSDALAGWRLRSSIGYARGSDRTSGAPLNSIDPLEAVLFSARRTSGMPGVSSWWARPSTGHRGSIIRPGALFVPPDISP